MSEKTRVWDILENHSIGMLTTRYAHGLRARPLDARPNREAGLIFFVTDVRGLKDDEIEASPDVCFTVIDPGEKAYLSVTARAEVLRDPALAEKVWKKTDDVWWPDGPADAHARVLRLTPLKAEFWDGPSSSIVASYEFAKARMTGEQPDLGQNRKVAVKLS